MLKYGYLNRFSVFVLVSGSLILPSFSADAKAPLRPA